MRQPHASKTEIKTSAEGEMESSNQFCNLRENWCFSCAAHWFSICSIYYRVIMGCLFRVCELWRLFVLPCEICVGSDVNLFNHLGDFFLLRCYCCRCRLVWEFESRWLLLNDATIGPSTQHISVEITSHGRQRRWTETKTRSHHLAIEGELTKESAHAQKPNKHTDTHTLTRFEQTTNSRSV